MQTRLFSTWIVAPASVVVPFAAVLLALRYQGGMWLLVGFAVGAGASVVLAELGARDARRQSPTR